MRTEKEMMDLIMGVAKGDERVRAVIMNGSRANPNAPKDIFQDFDVVYVVSDVAPFRRNFDWISQFGEIMIMQQPEDMVDPPPSENGGYAYLVQFADGNRIDLSLAPISILDDYLTDSLSLLLLDKDGIIPPFPPADEGDYLPTPPTAKTFADCCNEFWWVSTYVAKGLWREEITYAKFMMDHYVRDMLMKVLTWHIGTKVGFDINPGKNGKYFQRYLEPALWEALMMTYADGGYQNTWDALFEMGDLFRTAAFSVADHFGFDYNLQDDEKVSVHLWHVRDLQKDAVEMYG